MAYKITRWALTAGPDDRVLRGVLVVLADAAHHETGEVTLSIAEIGERALLARSAVSRRIGQLVDHGWIERVEDGFPGRPATYRVLGPHPVGKPDVVLQPENDVVLQSENKSFSNGRTRSFSNRRPTIRNTGVNGSNGSGASAPTAGHGRRLSPAERRARATCERCHGTGYFEPKPNAPVIACDHSPASESREVPDGF